MGKLLFVVGGALVMGIVHSFLGRRLGTSPSNMQSVIVGVVAACLVLLFSFLIHTFTSGRGTPEETVPWLVVIVIFADIVYLVWLRRLGVKVGAPILPTPSKSSLNGVESAAPHPTGNETETTAHYANRSQPARTHTIFLSYRRNDSAATTGRISDHLFASFGRESVLKDVDSVPLGVDYRVYVDELVGRCDVLIAVIGRTWVDIQDDTGQRRLENPRDLVRLEVEVALNRDIPVIPVLVDGADVPEEERLPEAIRALAFRNGIPIRPDPDFAGDMRRLISGLQALLGESETTSR